MNQETLIGAEFAEIYRLRRGTAVNHVGLTGVVAALAAIGCTDNNVIEPVTVDVACAGNAPTGKVVGSRAFDHKSTIG